MSDKPEFVDLIAPERKRTYHFPTGDVSFCDVVRVCVRPSGTHRLETADGKKHIVNPGWLALTLDMDAWTF